MKWHKSKVLMTAALALRLSANESGNLQNRLTNADIIAMIQAGMSADVIVAKVENMGAANPGSLKFDTSVDGLKALKEANVPDAVIKAVITPSPAVASTASSGFRTTDLPPAETGVYWKDSNNFVFIDGQTIRQAKVGGMAGNMFSYGLRGLHWDAFLNGPTSKNIVKDRQPVFYMYVPDGSSASDFVLIRLIMKNNRREFQIGTFGGLRGG